MNKIRDNTNHRSYIAYFDGACEPINPGGTASYGAIIFQDDQPVWTRSELYHPEPGHERETSNNIAEYAGFIAVLEWFVQQGLFGADIRIFGDSQLVIKQMFGTWRIKQGLYAPLAHKARGMLKAFDHVQGEWIPRERNGVADGLSKTALKGAGVRLRLQPVYSSRGSLVRR